MMPVAMFLAALSQRGGCMTMPRFTLLSAGGTTSRILCGDTRRAIGADTLRNGREHRALKWIT
jgi:hypothetical protein